MKKIVNTLRKAVGLKPRPNWKKAKSEPSLEHKKKSLEALLYAMSVAPYNDFVRSCKSFYDEKGYLSNKQIECLYKVGQPRSYESGLYNYDSDEYEQYDENFYDPGDFF